MRPRPSTLDHVKNKFRPNPLWMSDSPTLEHVYAYMMDGIDERERTVFRAWFISTCRGIIPSDNVHITFDKVKSSFNEKEEAEQEKILRRVEEYVDSYQSRPDPHAQILQRLLEMRDYFQEHIKKPTPLTLGKS